MKRSMTLATVGMVTLGVLSLTACSSPQADPTSETTTTAVVGADPATWSPVRIGQDANGTTVDLVVGQAAVFDYWPDGDPIVVSSDPVVVSVVQPRSDGSAEYAAGLTADAPGTAVVTVEYPDTEADDATGASNVVLEFTVDVAAQ